MISKSSAIQRAGRAGRTEPGKCYRLYSEEEFYEMRESSLPEIKKMHLGMAALTLLELGVTNIRGFDFIERPDASALDRALENLLMLGAIDRAGKLTAEGKEIAKLPLEPRASKIVLMGSGMGCRKEAVALGAMMASAGAVFLRIGTPEEKKLADEAKLKLCHENGDLLSLLEVYKEWELLKKRKERNQWCVKNYINAKTMRIVEETAAEINHALKNVRVVTQKEQKNMSESEIHVALMKAIIFAYYDNLAVFSGYGRCGYYSPRLTKLLAVHPSSVLHSLNHNHLFVVYQEILKTSADYIVTITPVINEDWLHEVCPLPEYALDPEEIRSVRLVKCPFVDVGDSVLRALIGKQGTNLRHFENQITDEGRIAGAIETVFEEGIINVYTSSSPDQRYEIIARKLIKNFITKQKVRLLDEYKELFIGRNGSPYRMILGKGGVVSNVLQPLEFLTIDIFLKESDGIQISSEMVASVSEMISRTVTRCGDVADIKCFIDNTPSSNWERNVKWGRVTFKSAKAAAEAVKQLSMQLESGTEIVARPARSFVGSQGYAQTETSVKVMWSRRASRGFGFVKCEDSAMTLVTAFILNGRMVGSKIIRCKLDKKDGNSIFVSNIDPMLTSDELKVELQRHTANQLMDVKVVYHKNILQKSWEQESATYKRILQQHTQRHLPTEINILSPKGESPYVFCYLKLPSAQQAHEVVQLLDGQAGLLGTQRVKATLILNTSIFCSFRVYDVLQERIDSKIDQIKGRGIKVVISDDRQKTAKILSLKAENIEALLKSTTELRQIVEGRVLPIENPKELLVLNSHFAKQKLKDLSLKLECIIEFDNRMQQLLVFGNDSTTVEAEVRRLLRTLYDENYFEVSLRKEGWPPGLMKALIKKYGSDLNCILNGKEGSIKLDIRRHLIKAVAPSEVQEDILNKIKECMQEITQRPLIASSAEEDCAVCFCPLDQNKYRLQYCGHQFCVECVSQQILSAVQDKNYPIKCVNEGCSSPFVIQDFLRLLGTTKRNDLSSSALNDFVNRNQESYRYCLTPNCKLVYRISEDGEMFMCPSCGRRLCTTCHVDYHDGMTCAIYKATKGDPDWKSVMEWARDKKDVRNCPGCKMMIEKNGGCMHMTCKNCNIHICWRCMKTFGDSNACYNHLGSCGGIFG